MSHIGRNQLCPCGSGKKYKRCHGAHAVDEPALHDGEHQAAFEQSQREFKARGARREKQQGLGRPIIAAKLNSGHQMVAVGNRVHFSTAWRTFYQLATGEYINAVCPISDAELAAYRRYPETFFGEVREPSRHAKTLVDLCDFFYETYKNTTRENLLEWMTGSPDIEMLQTLSREDLAIIFCERLASSAIQRR